MWAIENTKALLLSNGFKVAQIYENGFSSTPYRILVIPTHSHSHLHAYNTFTFDKLHTFNFIHHKIPICSYKYTITNTQESWYIQKIHQNPNDTHFYSHNKVNSIKMIKQLTYKQSKTKQKGKTSTRQVCIPKIFPPISSHTQLVRTIIVPPPPSSIMYSNEF